MIVELHDTGTRGNHVGWSKGPDAGDSSFLPDATKTERYVG